MGWNVFAGPLWARGFLIAFVGAAALVACSSDQIGAGLASKTAPGSSSAVLPAALATACIGSSPASQTTPLPTAGGVTGTVTVGAVASPATSCALTAKVATGADASLQSTVTDARVRKVALAAASPLPSPLAQIELSTTTTTSSWLAVTLTLPVSVPAGNYPATITTTVDLGDGQTYTTTTNYTLTVASNGTAALRGLNVTLGQYSAGLLTIYPAGTVLPVPSPTPTPSATPTGSPTPTATPTAKPSPTATPTATPTPTPSPSATPTAVPTAVVDCLNANALTACGSYISNGSYDGPAGYYSPAPTAGVSTPQPLYNHSIQGLLEGYVTIPYLWFTGTITITLDNYAPGQQQKFTNNCPSTFTVAQSGTLGDTYTLTFPANGVESIFSGGVSSCNINIGVPNESASGGAYNLNFGYINSLPSAQI